MKKQQGDVILKSCDSIPSGAIPVPKKPRGFVLAEGEHTGHAHIIEDGVEIFEKEGTLYIKVLKEASLKHEEHDPITLEPGIFRVHIVREYDPFLEEARQVRD